MIRVRQAGFLGVQPRIPPIRFDRLRFTSASNCQDEPTVYFPTMKTLAGLAVHNQTFSDANYEVLSVREREVMALAVRGFANKTIARELSITEGTIKLHLHRIYQKLGVKGRFALAVLARELPLDRPDMMRLIGQRSRDAKPCDDT
jgi:DNA-binding CsgD family transcriptional regulator